MPEIQEVYQVRVNLILSEKSEADAIWQAVKNYIGKDTVVTLLDQNSFVEYRLIRQAHSRPTIGYEVIERIEK